MSLLGFRGWGFRVYGSVLFTRFFCNRFQRMMSHTSCTHLLKAEAFLCCLFILQNECLGKGTGLGTWWGRDQADKEKLCHCQFSWSIWGYEIHIHVRPGLPVNECEWSEMMSLGTWPWYRKTWSRNNLWHLWRIWYTFIVYLYVYWLFISLLYILFHVFFILIFIYCLICCRSRGAGPNDTQVSKARAEACTTATALLWSHVFVGGELLGPLVERWAGRRWLHFVDIDIRSVCKLPTSGFFFETILWCDVTKLEIVHKKV